MLAFTRTRKGGIVTLTWQDIDFEKTKHSLERTENLQSVLLKLNIVIGIISLDDFTKNILKKYKGINESNMLFSDKNQKPYYLSFPNVELENIHN